MKTLLNRNKRSFYRGGAATLIACGAFLLPEACGPTGEPNSVITAFNVGMTDQDIKLDMVFSDQFQLNMDAMIPIINNFTGVRYGEVDLVTNPGGSGFTLSLAVDRSQLPQFGELVEFEQTQKLPNGQPMSNYINAPLYRLTFHPNPEIEVSIYLGPTKDNFYLGAAVGFAFMDQNFPPELVLTQLIQDKEKRKVAAASIFGPKIQTGMVLAHGGLFIATNINKLIEYYPPVTTNPSIAKSIPLQPYSKLDVQGPNAVFYRNPHNLLPLLNKFNNASEGVYPRSKPAVIIRGDE